MFTEIHSIVLYTPYYPAGTCYTLMATYCYVTFELVRNQI